MEQLHIPVRLQKLEKTKGQTTAKRTTIGTVYFQQGTTANQVCVHITKTQKSDFGLWLLQKAKNNNSLASMTSDSVDDGDYETVKDSKYVLEDDVQYVALHYSGADIELTIE